jgi:uncharacterized membrane protein YidH (DUF202 family)
MSEEYPAENKGGTPARGSTRPQASEPPSTLEGKPTTEDELKKMEREMTAFERSTLAWTRTVVFVYLATALLIGLQWWVMKGTLDEMRRSGQGARDQTNALISNMNWLARTMDGALQQNQRAMDSSQKQSKVALDASIAASRLDQRPWVWLDRFSLLSEPEEGKDILVSYSILNGGKSPAFEETTQSRLFLWEGMPPVEVFPRPKTTHSTSVVTQGDTKIRANSQRWTPEKRLVDGYKRGMLSLYLQAIVRYRDSNNRSHWTRVCAYHVRGAPLGSFNLCPTGNDMDH